MVQPNKGKEAAKKLKAKEKAKVKAKEKQDQLKQGKMDKWEESYTFSNDELSRKLNEFRCPEPVHGPLDLDLMSPIDLFELFFDDDVVGYICQQTNKYAMEKGAERWDEVGVYELRSFIGILLLSGYNKLPSRKMY